MMSLSGSCLCGSLKYTCSVEPVLAGNCHCRDCQKSSGSAYAPTFFVPTDAIVTSGEVKFYASQGGSGQLVRRGFCPTCGSQVLSIADSMPGLTGVYAGTLDDTSRYQPQVDIFVSRAARWDFIPPSAHAFAEMPPHPPV